MMYILWRSLGGMLAVISFGVVLRVPRRFLIWAGIDGAIGGCVYLLVERRMESVLMATFIGALVISFIAHIFARIFKTPVTIFLIPANMTIVPGAGMYRIVYYILKSNSYMSAYYFQQTFLAAGAIVGAIFIVNTVLGGFKSRSQGVKKNSQKFNE